MFIVFVWVIIILIGYYSNIKVRNDFLPSSQAFLWFIESFEICRNILMLLIYFHLKAVSAKHRVIGILSVAFIFGVGSSLSFAIKQLRRISMEI